MAAGASAVGDAPWIAASAVGAFAALALLVPPRAQVAAIAAASVACGFALASTEDRRRAPAGVPPDGMPVLLDGVVATAPRRSGDGADRLSDHLPSDASQSFALEIRAAHGPAGPLAIDGTATVRVAGLARIPARGSVVRVRGWAAVRSPARNPGIRAREPAVSIDVPSATLVEDRTPAGPMRAAVAVRRIAAESLRECMPAWADDGCRALVSAMTTGVRLPGLAEHGALFRDAGMSHVLAISGFNVGVLVAAAAVAARLCGMGAAGRALVALGVALAFLAITEPETSVLRAGVGAGIAAAASLRGGRTRALGILGATAACSMAIDIGCIRGAGFQLSYGVVLALLLLSSQATDRWCRRLRGAMAAAMRRRPGEVPGLLADALAAAVVSATVAWTASVPIAAAHGGAIPLLAVPLSVLTMPVAAATTVAGVGCTVFAGPLPACGAAFGWSAAAGAASLGWIARFAASIPGAAVAVVDPPWWACAACVVLVALAWRAGRRPSRIACMVTAALCMAWMAWPPRHGGPEPGTVEITRIRVARGECTLVRSADTTVILGAGSGGSLDAGSRTVVPALRALGCGRIDAVLLPRTTLAWISAVPELVRHLGADRVLVERSALESMSLDRDGAAAELLGFLRGHRIEPQPFEVGQELRIGVLDLLVTSPAERRHEFRVRPRGDPAGTADAAQAWLPVPASRDDPADAACRTTWDAGGTRRDYRWDGEGWRPDDAGTTSARSSTAKLPASEPSADASSTSNGPAESAAESATSGRSGERRSRRTSRPPERTTRSGEPASRAVGGRRTVMRRVAGDPSAG